jgi:TonB-dependent SusC/RagA subfamily outer membrane receptor
MIAYIVKSSLSLLILFGIYWFFLRRVKLLVFNRFFLIFSILFSLLIPFIAIQVNIQSHEGSGRIFTALTSNLPDLIPGKTALKELPYQTYVEDVPDGVNSTGINIKAILSLLYVAGLIIFMFRFFRNIRFIINDIRLSENIDYSGVRMVLSDRLINPYCFCRTIFVNKQDYLKNKIAGELLKHELEHIRQLHSFDVIFVELVRIFYWFNPLLILYNNAIKVNHEYLADNSVIMGSPDIRNYAEKLLKFVSCSRNIPLTSDFSQSLTKKRLIMMAKSRSRFIVAGSRIALTSFIILVLFLFLGFRKSTTDFQTSLANIEIAEPVQNVVKGIVTDEKGKPLGGVFINVSSGSAKVVTDEEGHFMIEGVPENAFLAFSHAAYETEIIKAEFTTQMAVTLYRVSDNRDIGIYSRSGMNSPLVIVDGEVSNTGIDQISPGDISTISVLKDARARSLYGERSANGVVIITSKKKAAGTPADYLAKADNNAQQEAKSPAGQDIDHTGQDAVVAPVNMNILYRGISNPVEIAVPGVPSDEVTAAITNGSLVKKDQGWEVMPEGDSESVITVFVRNEKVSEKRFRVKNIPVRTATVAGTSSGSIDRTAASQATELQIELSDFPFDQKFEITGFTFLMRSNNKDIQLYSGSNKLTDEMRAYIADLQRGQEVIFKDIRAEGPDGKIINILPIILKIY